MNRFSLLSGALFGLLGVALGAFGAHALKPVLVETGRLDTFELAVRYQFYHALALLVNGIMGHFVHSAKLKYAAISFVTGILFFSGSLFVLSLTGIGVLGAITPIGGFMLIIGWAFMITAVWESHKKSP
jgi:uncharacterized membrane protein YgdD (TMEM256/DUF423 family)